MGELEEFEYSTFDYDISAAHDAREVHRMPSTDYSYKTKGKRLKMSTAELGGNKKVLFQYIQKNHEGKSLAQLIHGCASEEGQTVQVMYSVAGKLIGEGWITVDGYDDQILQVNDLRIKRPEAKDLKVTGTCEDTIRYVDEPNYEISKALQETSDELFVEECKREFGEEG